MLDTRNVSEALAAGTEDEYRKSRTVTTITEDLVARYRAGGQKYGTFIDDAQPPTELTGETTFAQMAYNEALDAVTYSLKAQEEYASLEAKHAALVDRHKALNRIADDFTQLNADLVERVAELEAEVELARFESSQARQEGDLSKEQEAELVHANVQLEVQIEELKKEIVVHRGRATRLGNSLRQYQTVAAERQQKLDKLPRLVKKMYGVSQSV